MLQNNCLIKNRGVVVKSYSASHLYTSQFLFEQLFPTFTIYKSFRFQFYFISDTLYIQDTEIVTSRFAKDTYCHPAAPATVELIL